MKLLWIDISDGSEKFPDGLPDQNGFVHSFLSISMKNQWSSNPLWFQGYISDTEDTLSYEGKDVQIFKQIKEKEEEEKLAQEKLAKENQEKLATEKAEKASTGGSHVVDNISNGGGDGGTSTNVLTETHAKTEL